ncbi:hypothetical protein TRIP_C60039 [Candidatus Zixiibacteriota bacterium]|nr:hypothetical protein TRIP_C60039 [candidate division Zixibacteria bacterium]
MIITAKLAAIYLPLFDLVGQLAFEIRLNYCNTERPHRGYRNMGKRPIETI